MNRFLPLLACVALAADSGGCGREPAATPAKSEAQAMPTNRVDIPANVRQNLGITFAKVESRFVSRTLRLPGVFELLPTATREYRAVAAGRVEVLVEQHAAVSAGQPLCRIESPRLRELQQQIAEAAAGLTLAKATVDSLPPFFDAHEKHHAEVERSVTLWTDRLKRLEEVRDAGGGQANEVATATASLNDARAKFAETLEKEAELNARKVETDASLMAARQKYNLLLATMASLTAVPQKDLMAADSSGTPAWQKLEAIELRAAVPGVVSLIGVTNGAYVDAAANLLTVIRPDQLRFRARGYQADLGRLTAGLPARVVPPAGTGAAEIAPMTGPLMIAPQGMADARLIDLFVRPDRVAPWALDGVAGFMEITLAGSASAELAVPSACVVRDGVTPVLFRRDPRDPNKVIRMEADLGTSDGRWVVLNSGVAEGNEIVLDGAYQLLVATSGTVQKGGHFHPDGTFHDGED